MSIVVKPVSNKRDMETFIRFPWRVYEGDATWIPPLLMERRDAFDRAKNPVFTHLDAEYFLAFREGDVVGRVSAQVDHEHNRLHGEQTGFFGALESVNDRDVAAALFDAVREWAGRRGMDRVRGPFTLNINEEAGLLVEGFEDPPIIMTNYAKPYYGELVETCGFSKCKDLFGWRYDVGAMNPTAAKIGQRTMRTKNVKVRSVDMSRFGDELRLLLDIFNSAWRENWGFIPLNDAEIEHAAKEMKLVIIPHLALVAEVDGEPAAIAVTIYNLNEVLADLDGKLFPFGLAKLIWRMKVKRPRTGRLILLGVREEYRGMAVGGSLPVLLYYETHKRTQELGIVGGEIGWTLEDNVNVNKSIEFMGGTHYKTYRIYEAALVEGGTGDSSGADADDGAEDPA